MLTMAKWSAGECVFPTLHWRAAAARRVVHRVQLGRPGNRQTLVTRSDRCQLMPPRCVLLETSSAVLNVRAAA